MAENIATNMITRAAVVAIPQPGKPSPNVKDSKYPAVYALLLSAPVKVSNAQVLLTYDVAYSTNDPTYQRQAHLFLALKIFLLNAEQCLAPESR